MELPVYHETFLPILKILSDGKVLHRNDLRIRVRDEFFSDLPQELLEQKIKTGDNSLLNRIGWGMVYLKQGKMVQQPERSMFQITEKGKAIFEKGKLNLQELLKDSDFQAHRKLVKEKKESEPETINENASPEDLIDSGILAIEEQTKSDLLEKLQEMNPYDFEIVVLKLLEKMGYGEFQSTSKSRDGGIDGIIYQDQLGIDKIYIQSKRNNENNKVREPEIRNFIGAMSSKTSKGIFVTTSFFDSGALQGIRDDHHHQIIPIDGAKLVELMYKFGVGVQVRHVYEVKEIDEEFFEEG